MVPSRTKCYNLKGQLKFLQHCTCKEVIKAVLKASTDDVIKVICNAALNIQKAQVCLSRKDKCLFRKNREVLRKLLDENISVKQKRVILIKAHTGIGTLLVPALLNCAHKSFGTLIFSLGRLK